MPKDNRPKPIRFPLPLAGLNTVSARTEQPTRASVDLQNVRMFDVSGKMRVGSREGTTTLLGQTNQLGVTHTNRSLLCLHQADFIDGSSNRATWLIAVAGRDVYQIDVAASPTITTVGSAQFLASRRVMAATLDGYTYLIDGATPRRINLQTKSIAAWTATTGTVPTDMRLMIAARGRIFMASSDANPQNWSCSRQGDARDWDTGQLDVGAAVIGNSSFRGGGVGEPITALIRGKDATVIFGCRNSIYELVGEPTSGQILTRSTGIGILFSDGWCMGPEGEIYFIGTGGFYVLPESGPPQALNITQVQSYFDGLPASGYFLNCVYDPDRYGVHIFITPEASGGGRGAHLFYNKRTGGFEPQDYPEDHGPCTALLFDSGTAAVGRQVILGGRKGIIMKLDKSVSYDANSSGTSTANTAYTSRATFGPIQAMGLVDRAKLIETLVFTGDTPTGLAAADFNCTVTLKAGSDPYGAVFNPQEQVSFTLAGASIPATQQRRNLRIRANSHAITFTNSTSGKWFSIDAATARFLPGGRDR